MNNFWLIFPVLGLTALQTTAAVAAPIRAAMTDEFKVTNQSGMDAQDLELDYLEASIIQGAAANPFTANPVIPPPPNNNSITFSGGTVKNNATMSGTVTFKPTGPGDALNKAFWTYSAPGVQPIPIPLPKITIGGGKKVSLPSPTGFEGFMTLVSDETSTVYISNLTMAINIPEAEYDPTTTSFEDDLNIPDGTAVTSFPTSLTLAPGQEIDFDLGPVDATDYEAMQFDLSFSSGSAVNGLGFASDVIISEPSTLFIFATALTGLGLFLVRGRYRAHMSQ